MNKNSLEHAENRLDLLEKQYNNIYDFLEIQSKINENQQKITENLLKQVKLLEQKGFNVE